MMGAEGIAVGMATKILPHNLIEIWEAQIAVLRKKKFELFPDFQQGGLMDVAAYDDGAGKIDLRAKIETLDRKKVVIREIPFGTTTESLIASIEAAVGKGRVKIVVDRRFHDRQGRDRVDPGAWLGCEGGHSATLRVHRLFDLGFLERHRDRRSQGRSQLKRHRDDEGG